MEKVRLGIIGTGNMGRNHVRVAKNLRDLYDLVGIYDADPMQAKRIAELNEVKAFGTIDELLDQVEAVVLAVPSSLHREIGLQVAEKGVHALIEKPLATTSEDAKVLSDAFEAKGLHLMVGHIERFNPVIRELDKVLQGKQIYHIEAHRFSPFSGSGRITDTSVVEDLMIHDVDLVCFLMRNYELKQVMGAGEHVETERLDFASAMMLFDPRAHATVSVSRVAQGKERSIHVHAKDCSIYADLLSRTLTISQNANLVVDVEEGNSYRQEGTIQKIFVPIEEPLQGEHTEFYHVVRGDYPSVINGEVGIRAIEICEKVIKGAEGGKIG